MGDYVYNELLKHVIAGRDLDRGQAHWCFTQIMGGAWNEAQVAGLLVALAAKGETVDELAGAGQAMREHAVKIDTGGADVLDTCGTGGTGLSTFNVSTAVALVAAGAGVKVAKHGNRTHTRASGSADVLEALGVNLDAPPDTVERCLAEANVCFCFAVKCHPSMKYAGPVRKALGVRTIFNMLGPLTNPAGAKRQVMGVFDGAWVERIAEVLRALGATRAMVLHAEDGLDEISIGADTHAAHLKDGHVELETLTPEAFGIERTPIDALSVDSPQDSARIIRDALAGQAGPPRDMVLINAAAALMVAGRSDDLAAGMKMAAASVDSGAAAKALETLVAVSNE